jgi:hypothetical protein
MIDQFMVAMFANDPGHRLQPISERPAITVPATHTAFGEAARACDICDSPSRACDAATAG